MGKYPGKKGENLIDVIDGPIILISTLIDALP